MENNPAPNTTPAVRSGFLRVKTWRATFKKMLPVVLVMLSAFGAVILYEFLYPAPEPPDQSELDRVVWDAMASATPEPARSAQVYQAILPSLVFVQTRRPPEAQEDEGVGIGSGVVINSAGDILTALHVVEGASEIDIVFADGTEATAEIIATEPEIDIAVLRPSQPPEVIVPAILGNPGTMRVGDEAFAVGNPFGLAGSMSAGVISGFDRSTRVQTGQRLEGLIQFDTAVNPGSSGGPLLNEYGQVVGIVTGLANPSEENFFIGIGFAVPIGTAVSAAGGPAY